MQDQFLGFTNDNLIVASECEIKYVRVPAYAFYTYDPKAKRIIPFDLDDEAAGELTKVKLKKEVRILSIVEIY